MFKGKGETKNIENYCPIGNFCYASEIFEKLILKQNLYIKEAGKVDLTGQNQHGFKEKRSAGTLSLDLQTKIARALDDDEYVMVASLDLSSAFDILHLTFFFVVDKKAENNLLAK